MFSFSILIYLIKACLIWSQMTYFITKKGSRVTLYNFSFPKIAKIGKFFHLHVYFIPQSKQLQTVQTIYQKERKMKNVKWAGTKMMFVLIICMQAKVGNLSMFCLFILFEWTLSRRKKSGYSVIIRDFPKIQGCWR